jgi:diguanylate cyclase (GGDEF)-like protein
MTGCGGIGWMEVPQARSGAWRGRRWRAAARRSQAWRWRWARFRRDCRAAASFRVWLPVIAASTLASSVILAANALQSERYRNELIRRTASDQLNFIAHNLEVETRDWATWDETYLHATGRNGNYYGKGNYTRETFLRLPLVMALDRQGTPISSARWNDRTRRIEPLPPAQVQEILGLLPERRGLRPRTFMAVLQGRPHLFSMQPIFNSRRQDQASGRLLMARSLSGADHEIARNALALQRYQFEPVRSLRPAPLGPLAIAIRAPRWDGLQPLQITVLRPASERIGALGGLGLLLGLDVAVLTLLLLQAYGQRRSRRHQTCLQLREQQRLRRELNRRENRDGLTGLLNEHGLLAAMEPQRRAHPTCTQALLLIDIRHFALINTSFGRDFGDQVLIALARWLEQQLEPGSLIARSGGDVFSCCLMGPSEALLRTQIQALTGRLQQLDLQVDERLLRIAISAGARILTDGSAQTALHEAGVARDLAKLSGRQPCQFYGDELTTMQSYMAMQRLNQDLVASLKQNRIALFAQAAWRLDRSDLPAVYVEFLSRLHDPQAEGRQRYRWSEALVEAATICGSMPLLDSHVLELSCRSLQELLRCHRDEPALEAMVFAINLTADTLLADDFCTRVESLLERHGLDPQRLCFEITEQAAVRNLTVVTGAMQRLRRLGLRFALDDFGAGMTSLSHLRDLPLDYVKIDKAFIWRVKGDPSSRLTVDFLVRMGRELGFDIIAEGVEDLPLLYFLRDLGVTIAQGYVTSIPSLFDCRAAELGFSRCGRALLGEQLSLVG